MKPTFESGGRKYSAGGDLYPRADSNRGFRLRRPALYPLSYGGETGQVYLR